LKKALGNVDSKFRFVILASKRAKQLLKGAKPKVKGKSKNPIRIAQNELKLGLVDYAIIPVEKEDMADSEEQVFLGDELRDEGDAGGGDLAEKDELEDVEGAEEADKEEFEQESSEEFAEGISGEDKDEEKN
jgi:DNA-directed RNA polymerase omega subunit